MRGDIYKYDYDNKLFISLGEIDHDMAEDLRSFWLRPEMAEICSPLLVIQGTYQITFCLHWKREGPIPL